jgi:hypothetical protein
MKLNSKQKISKPEIEENIQIKKISFTKFIANLINLFICYFILFEDNFSRLI